MAEEDDGRIRAAADVQGEERQVSERQSSERQGSERQGSERPSDPRGSGRQSGPRRTDEGPAGSGPSAAHSRGSGQSESSIPEPLRRLLEAGLARLGERPEMIKQRLGELKLPREAWTAILSQLEDRKSGLYRLVAKEVRDLLENTNVSEELVKALTMLSFEIKTEVRFIPNDKGLARPNIRSAVKVKSKGDTDDESTEHGGTGEGLRPRDKNERTDAAAGASPVAPSSTTATRATPHQS